MAKLHGSLKLANSSFGSKKLTEGQCVFLGESLIWDFELNRVGRKVLADGEDIDEYGSDFCCWF